MKLTRTKLKEIIREELLKEAPEGRVKMYAKSITQDANFLLNHMKKGDFDKDRLGYYLNNIKDSMLEIEKNMKNI